MRWFSKSFFARFAALRPSKTNRLPGAAAREPAAQGRVRFEELFWHD
jgi:hypothetical protein